MLFRFVTITSQICFSELMPRQSNFDKFKLHTDRSVVNELKAELWNTKEVSGLRFPDNLTSIPSRFFAQYESSDISDGDGETVQTFVNKSLHSYRHKPRQPSEDVWLKLKLLEERLSQSRSEVSLWFPEFTQFHNSNTASWPSA